ncbi:MAG TPA: response regulator transcription factor [Candidatus Binataceae bacterium]|nr:response regulator transcription factor [Candidatus Binataceae bacterium]
MNRPTRLLVVEDEARLAENLRRGLSEAGYVVDTAPSAEDARGDIGKQTYDLMILDLRLPGLDGIEFLRELRAAGSSIPVLILTARNALEDRVGGLDSGADDYLVKPFAWSELLARVRALLRRPATTGGKINVGEISIDRERRVASRGRRKLDLSPKEMMILEFLGRHPGVPVSRDMIGEAVWGTEYNSLSNIVEVFINRLRQKIDLVNHPSLIITVRGKGYLLRTDDWGGSILR